MNTTKTKPQRSRFHSNIAPVVMIDASLRRQLEELIGKQAPYAVFTDFAALCQIRPGTELAKWKDAIAALARMGSEHFSWLNNAEASLLRMGAGRQLATGISEGWPFQNESIEEDELKSLIGIYTDWLASQPDDRVGLFCWTLLRCQPRRHGTLALAPVYWLFRQGRLRGDIDLASIELAVALTDEESAMFWWPDQRWQATDWATQSKPYLEFLNHSSSLVRAAAAKCLGRLQACLRHRPDTPALPDLLNLVGDYESRTSGIAGPFLEGGDWGIQDWRPFLGDFDMRDWFLTTLRNSEKEPDWPEAQALEYYAHLYLSSDGAAIEELIEMGREDMALMAATADPDNVELLRPVLESLARSENPRIAEMMREYLAEHGQQTGQQWVN